MITYLQAAVIGLLQGVTELFPISSLGHSVLLPAFIGGSWEHLVTESSTGSSNTSPYLAFVIALHVATAIALLIFFRADWVRIIRGFLSSLQPSLAARRPVTADDDQRLAWLVVIATIPVGVIGLVAENPLRRLFATPLAAAVFLTGNGVLLLVGELLRRRADRPQYYYHLLLEGQRTEDVAPVPMPRRRVASLHYLEATFVGGFQSLALLAGISRSGATMVGGLARGLSHEDAARFSFLLATPVILAAGLLKLPSLAGPAGQHIHGQVILGAAVAGCAAYACVKWLTRYFKSHSLIPFAIYSLVVGAVCIARFA